MVAVPLPLTTYIYGPEMGFMQSLALGKKMIMWLLGIPLVPIFCVIYIVSPRSKVHHRYKYATKLYKTFGTLRTLSSVYTLPGVLSLSCARPVADG